MSFELMVLAVEPPADRESVTPMAYRCRGRRHVEGDLDPRIVSFYEALRLEYPDDHFATEGPWASAPLGTGIDHIHMFLNDDDPNAAGAALERIDELAEEHDLVVWHAFDGSTRVPSVAYLTQVDD